METCRRCEHTWVPRGPSPVRCPRCGSTRWRTPPASRGPADGLNRFVHLFSVLNHMRMDGVIHDWVLFGAVALLYYDEVRPTRDTDVVVEVSTEADYDNAVLPYLRTVGRERPAGVFEFEGLFLQVIPQTDSALFPGMIRDARREVVGGETVKIASPEYLVVSALARFNNRDIERIMQLHPLVDRRAFLDLLRDYDATGELRRNLNLLRRRARLPL